MRYASLHEFFTMDDKTMPLIKIEGMSLGMQMYRFTPCTARLTDQILEYDAADTALTPALDHRHASDITVGQQAAGAYRQSLSVQRQRVYA